MKYPLVTIVLPTYNRAAVLPYALQSVVNQTYENWELIVVDDNSSDSTPSVFRDIEDGRVKYFRNENNLKLPRSLNRGFENSKGKLLTWTSDDNIYAPNSLERMVHHLVKNESDFVYADYWEFSETDKDGKPLNPRRQHLSSDLQLEQGNHIGACFLYTKELYDKIGEYDPELFLVEDFDFFIRAAKLFRFSHVPESLYYFRRDDETLYYSRYCEVKASDVLVRYKNGLIDIETAAKTLTILLTENLSGLKNPALRLLHDRIAERSFKLSHVYRKILKRHFFNRIRGELGTIFPDYGSGQPSFVETRDEICKLMKRIKIESEIRPQ